MPFYSPSLFKQYRACSLYMAGLPETIAAAIIGHRTPGDIHEWLESLRTFGIVCENGQLLPPPDDTYKKQESTHTLEELPQASPAYVVLHAQIRRQKRQKPAAPYNGIRNPRLALQKAQEDCVHLNFADIPQVLCKRKPSAIVTIHSFYRCPLGDRCPHCQTALEQLPDEDILQELGRELVV